MVDTGVPAHEPLAWLGDDWAEVKAHCPPFVGEAANTADFEATRDRYDATPECQELLLEQVAVDASALGQPERGWYEREIAVTLYDIAMRDLGTLADLDRWVVGADSAYLRQPFADELHRVAEHQGTDLVQAALYDLVVASLQRTVLVEEIESNEFGFIRAQMDGRTLTVAMGEFDSSLGGSMLLVHEATHAWLDLPHVRCPEGTIDGSFVDNSGRTTCDETWRGTYGFAGGHAGLLWLTLPDSASEDFEAWLSIVTREPMLDAWYLILENDSQDDL